MKINPSYVTFEQAKWLKEKGFNVLPHYIVKTDYVLGYEYDKEDTSDYIKTREFQWEDHICSHLYLMPEQYQVIEWLRTKHNVWIQPMLYRRHPHDYVGAIYHGKNESNFTEPMQTPQEAISLAFDYIKKNNLL